MYSGLPQLGVGDERGWIEANIGAGEEEHCDEAVGGVIAVGAASNHSELGIETLGEAIAESGSLRGWRRARHRHGAGRRLPGHSDHPPGGCVKVGALIADDEPVARAGLREMLAEVPWLACVGEAASGPAAVAEIDRLHPELVFLDVQMPGLLGTDVLQRVRHQPLVVFTTAFAQHAVEGFEARRPRLSSQALRPRAAGHGARARALGARRAGGAARLRAAARDLRQGAAGAAIRALGRRHRPGGGARHLLVRGARGLRRRPRRDGAARAPPLAAAARGAARPCPLRAYPPHPRRQPRPRRDLPPPARGATGGRARRRQPAGGEPQPGAPAATSRSSAAVVPPVAAWRRRPAPGSRGAMPRHLPGARRTARQRAAGRCRARRAGSARWERRAHRSRCRWR